MATQAERTQKYFDAHGIKQKKSSLEPEILAVFDTLAKETGKSHTALLREAMLDLAAKYRRPK